MNINNMIDSAIRLIENLQRFRHDTEKMVYRSIRRAKRRALAMALQIVLYLFGAVLIVAGGILFLSRYFSIDMVLLVSGVVIVFISLIVGLGSR